jgi:PAS domain S-box-containing protein
VFAVGDNEAFVLPDRMSVPLRQSRGGLAHGALEDSMLDLELFALLECTADATYTVSNDGEICSWNASAERLFGYAAEEVIGRNVDTVLDARDILGTDALAGGADAAARQWSPGADAIAAFDLEIRTRNGDRIWINVSTIVFDNPRTRRRLFVRLARNVDQRRRKEALLGQMLAAARQVVAINDEASGHSPVEVLSTQEKTILSLFAEGRNSAAIARKLKISPQTLRNHLHHINRKLRTHTRLEAVTHAQRRGLID